MECGSDASALGSPNFLVAHGPWDVGEWGGKGTRVRSVRISAGGNSFRVVAVLPGASGGVGPSRNFLGINLFLTFLFLLFCCRSVVFLCCALLCSVCAQCCLFAPCSAVNPA